LQQEIAQPSFRVAEAGDAVQTREMSDQQMRAVSRRQL
jgi:hypothetical protein